MQICPTVRRKHTISLTPLIDVVFILLIFFMLASRLGVPQHLTLDWHSSGSNGEETADILTVGEQQLWLNGKEISWQNLANQATLPHTLSPTLLLRPTADATLQRLLMLRTQVQALGLNAELSRVTDEVSDAP